MEDNYKGEIAPDGKFTCFISRKILDYATECGLDFAATPRAPRILISNEEFKKAYLLATKAQATAQKEDIFRCYFLHYEFYTSQALALEFAANEHNEGILVSNDAYQQALVEGGKNKNEYIKRHK
ncbi:31097_t:CDS:1 [Racocetra persica]|uniref:31097_t:CDS:1 n=1 Tax=Racocetra persica TaxID=160502 RepID=A0ACA9QET6_9GLOM|nr:31097_t:CDS:1 [Racocetra persica]